MKGKRIIVLVLACVILMGQTVFAEGFDQEIENDENIVISQEGITVIQHPEDVTGQLGETISIQTIVQGEGLQYQWRYSFDGEVSDKEYGLYKTDSNVLSIPLTIRNAKAIYWCHITDDKGNSVNTKPCRLYYTTKEGYVASGVCGDSIEWTLDEEGNLWISGHGEMNCAPWRDAYESEIKTILIEGDIENIAAAAFYGCVMRTINIRSNITSIGSGAFYQCLWLKEITLPASLKTLSAEAFVHCADLEKIVMEGDAPENTSPDALLALNENLIIYVPEGASGYDATPWTDYHVVYGYTKFQKGDVNGDGAVDIQDLRMVLRYVCGKTDLTKQQLKLADVVEDGTVDIQDLRKVLRFVCGKIDSLE